MKKRITLFSLLLLIASLGFAQNNIIVSGTFTNNGQPKASELVTLYYYSLDSNSTAVIIDTTSTNSLGFYTKTKNLPIIYSSGYVLVETSNCNNGLQSKIGEFNPLKKNITINFDCPPVTCYSAFKYYLDTLFNSNYQVNFIASTPISIYRNYTWNFGDGSTAQGYAVSHNYTQAGSYIVCLTTTDSVNNCSYTYCDSIFVYSPSNTCYTAFNTLSNPASSNTLDFYAYSKSNTGTYIWDFGDGSTGTGNTVTHTYANPGFYTVCLTMIDSANSCTTSFCNLVGTTSFFLDSCSAEFKMAMLPDSTQTGSTVYFSLVKYNFSNYVYWNFGDGNSAIGQSVIHTYTTPGNYTVTVLNVDTATQCRDTVTKQLFVNRGTLKVVSLGIENNQLKIEKAYPNPVENSLNLALFANESESVQFTIRDLSGRIMWSNFIDLEKGNNNIQVNTEQLIAGMYLLELRTNRGISTTKLLKK